MNLTIFRNFEFPAAIKELFKKLNVSINYVSDDSIEIKDFFSTVDNKTDYLDIIDEAYFVGLVDDSSFKKPYQQVNPEVITKDYDGILIFGVKIKASVQPSRPQLVGVSRAFNREFHYTPVIVIFSYEEVGKQMLAFSNTERLKYKQEWREGEKVGKVTMLRDISIENPSAAHLKIIFGNKTSKGLRINPDLICSFKDLYNYWQTIFSIQALNDQFYGDLQTWFYYATQNIKLPVKPEYISNEDNIKNFLVRLLSRTMFCWFVKEKGLIRQELFELTDWKGDKYKLTNDIDTPNFLHSNSYYRGILQNIFFNALSKKEKSSIKDFRWAKYLHDNFDISWLTNVPYLNGGIFDELEEDNAKLTIGDDVIKIPNYLFYGIVTEEVVKKGKGPKKTDVLETIEHKGLNEILKSYKFTLDENTPFEEDIALDPEMLGLVFENLLAELDPNLEGNVKKSIRNLTGSYYTPRKIIYEMVNDSLYLYLKKYLAQHNSYAEDIPTKVSKLIYHDVVDAGDKLFCKVIVEALDKFRVLDPACGSGAFPMGMLHRMVDVLRLVDFDNTLWIEHKLCNVDISQREEFKKLLSQHLNDYSRKLGIIRDSIYGVDIQPMAVQITKLRFFISLLIDQKSGKEITPMPNIETKIICADTLNNIDTDVFSKDAIEKLTVARNRYYQPDLSLAEREIIANEIIDILNVVFPSFSAKVTGKSRVGQNKEMLKEWFKHGTIAAPFFNLNFFYPELTEHGGFDCIIGNPPYGGTKITDEVRKSLDIESKDPYGAFIARFLKSDAVTPLKHGGVLSFIVSDTFMTIKSHLKLRKHLMRSYVHKMLRVHPDTFRATVNTVIMVVERNTKAEFDDNHICLMADLTNISIHTNYEHFIEVLGQTKGVDFTGVNTNISNAEYALYYYPQSLIKTNSNLPFFVASPKLFALMNDGNDISRKPKSKIATIGGKSVEVRSITINEKVVEVVKLGTIAEVRQGLATGDNDAYLFQKAEARGTYRDIEEYKQYLLSDADLDKIRSNDKLRLEVIDKGISKDNPQSERYFGGKYIIPYDKGGESDADEGWMPNYYVPTSYFIDWSEWAVNRMKTLTIAQRIRENKENKTIKDTYENTTCAVFRSPDKYFTPSISFSRTGVYSPTFRFGTVSTFDTEGSMIFQDYLSMEKLSGVLSSKVARYFVKVFIGHTVHTQVDELKELIISLFNNDNLSELVNSIHTNQKMNSRYDYASYEQIEIDKLVYESFKLNANDVQEVENWFARCYPKLSVAQKANLRALGKSDNYLKLYGLI